MPHYPNRRKLLKFFGYAAGAGILNTITGKMAARTLAIPVSSIGPTAKDDLVLTDGLAYRVIIGWGDPINSRGDRFGFNNDYIALCKVRENPDDCLLWVNHESVKTGYYLTPDDPAAKTAAHVELERREVGGTIMRIRKSNGYWHMVKDDFHNRRIDAMTPIPLVSDRPIVGRTVAAGTLGNCAGGVTPWNTVLSAEENYHHLVGEIDFTRPGRVYSSESDTGWERFADMPPEHYGWVVEVNLFTGAAKKLTSMGRFAHESATVVQALDGRCVVYTADDKVDECIYKFIANRPGSLEQGTLYVANTDQGRWLPLDINTDSRLVTAFKDQTEVLIRAREAAHIVGGSALDRPEDIEQHPVSGAIYVTLTKNKDAGRPYGSILRIHELDNNPLSLEFNSEVLVSGGEESGFACPDNLVFDQNGNLWFSSDISGEDLNKPPYSAFGNNGLFFMPMAGPDAGQIVQIASAPVHAELTGLQFSPDGRTLFISVQHPGEESRDFDQPDSHWPDGGTSKPRSAIVTLQGEFIDSHCCS